MCRSVSLAAAAACLLHARRRSPCAMMITAHLSLLHLLSLQFATTSRCFKNGAFPMRFTTAVIFFLLRFRFETKKALCVTHIRTAAANEDGEVKRQEEEERNAESFEREEEEKLTAAAAATRCARCCCCCCCLRSLAPPTTRAWKNKVSMLSRPSKKVAQLFPLPGKRAAGVVCECFFASKQQTVRREWKIACISRFVLLDDDHSCCSSIKCIRGT